MFDLSWEQNQSFGPTIASSVELEKILKVGKRYRGPFQLDFVSRREAGWSVECREMEVLMLERLRWGFEGKRRGDCRAPSTAVSKLE